MSPAACAVPLTTAAVTDWWLGDLAGDEATRVEEHLLGCDDCGARLAEIIDLGASIRAVARRGRVRVVGSEAFLARLAEDGLRLRQYRVGPGGSVACTVAPTDDLVVARFTAPLGGVARVDLSVCDAEGRERHRLVDIPVSAAASEVIVLPPIDAIRALPATVERFRLLAVEAAGERLLAEYTFVHTPSA